MMNSIVIDDLITEGKVVAPLTAQPIINSSLSSAFCRAVAAAAAAVGDVIMPPVGRFSVNIYRRAVAEVGEEAFSASVVIMPPSTTGFIINGLLGFAQIKSQGKPEFPFETHPKSMMVSVTSLLIYGLASGAEQVISPKRFDPASVYTVVARFGRIGSVFVMIASLAAPFYI